MRDPYTVLGVDRNADTREIKAAYRTLVKRWHPDKHGENAAARERFLEVSEAYTCLIRAGRPATPAAAERSSRRKARSAKVRTPAPAAATVGEPASDAEMMERIFGVPLERTTVDDAPSIEPSMETQAPDPVSTAEKDPETVRPEPPQRRMVMLALNTLFPRFQRRRKPHEPESDQAPANAPDIRFATAPLEVILKGGSVNIDIEDGRSLTVEIARGMLDGTVLDAGAAPDAPETRVVVRYAFSDILWASGADVHAVLAVDLETAVLGGTRTFETLDGTIKLTVPAWSGSDRILRVAGRGLPKEDGSRGELFIHLRVLLAPSPDETLVDLLNARRNGLFV